MMAKLRLFWYKDGDDNDDYDADGGKRCYHVNDDY